MAVDAKYKHKGIGKELVQQTKRRAPDAKNLFELYEKLYLVP